MACFWFLICNLTHRSPVEFVFGVWRSVSGALVSLLVTGRGLLCLFPNTYHRASHIRSGTYSCIKLISLSKYNVTSYKWVLTLQFENLKIKLNIYMVKMRFLTELKIKGQNWYSIEWSQSTSMYIMQAVMSNQCEMHRTKCLFSSDELCERSREGYFGVYFPSCDATREINTKITHDWAQKQLVTRVHALFYFLYDITTIKWR